MTTAAPPVGGTTPGAAGAPVANYFGMPLYSTQRRFVPDSQNNPLGFQLNAGTQINLATTRLDQLDIVVGEKMTMDFSATWTNTGGTLEYSPFFPANLIQGITVKLQAAYNTYNLTGALAGLKQAFRPSWGATQVGTVTPSGYANMIGYPRPVSGTAENFNLVIDIPFAIYFDEYYELDAEGMPGARYTDEWVTPVFMAAQARTVAPSVTFAPAITVDDLLGGAVSKGAADVTSTFAGGAGNCAFTRDAFWTAANPAANPPQHPWIYTNDYFRQPTSGQNKVGCLIQNTGVSVGQVMALYGFVWDPALNSGFGGIVPSASISEYELVTGGSLQNILETPQLMNDRIRATYGFTPGVSVIPDGCFIFDYALMPEGKYLTNANCINTYIVNGVQLNISFVAGSVPSPSAVVYVGVEALKMATS